MATSETNDPVVGSESCSEASHERQQTSPQELMNAQASGDSVERHGRCMLWMKSHRLGWLMSLPEKWPRLFALIFGVVSFASLF